MIVAMIALFVALSGVAVAGTTGLISGRQIMDHSISFAKLSPTAAAQLRGQKGAAGSQGLQGPAGGQGQPGPAGGFDPNKITYAQSSPIDLAPFSQTGTGATMTASCPAGAKVLGGGGYNNIAIVGASLATNNGTAWTMIVINTYSITLNGLYAYAVCGSP